MPKNFSPSKLESIRKRRGYTRKQLAAAIARHTDTIRDFEHGRIGPSADTLIRLLEVLECQIDDLYDIKDSAARDGGAHRTKGRASRGRLLGESAAPSSGKSRKAKRP